MRSQILLAQVPAALIILFITALFIASLTLILRKSESTLTENFKIMLSIKKLSDSIEDLNGRMQRHPQEFDGKTKKLENKISRELMTQEQLAQTSSEKQLIQNLKKAWTAYKHTIHTTSSLDLIDNQYAVVKKMTHVILDLNQDALIQKNNALSDFIINYRFLISAVSIISLLFGFFMSWVFTGLFLTPLKKMTETVSQFGKTDETILLHLKGPEEIEKLSEEFNLMTSRLEEYHQSALGHLAEDYENLKKAFDAPPYPILIFREDNNILFLNKTALKLFGILQGITTKKPVFYIEKSTKESLLKIVTHVQMTHKSYFPGKQEEPIRIKRNLFVPFAYPIKDSKKKRLISVLLVLQDIRSQSIPELETLQITKNYVEEVQAPLAELQLAIYTSLQRATGPLTEKQEELLYVAQEKSSRLETLYQEFCRVMRISSDY
jgi:hypothetical protein